MKKYGETLSYGEKRLIDITKETRKIAKDLLISDKENKDKFEKMAELQSEILGKLNEDTEAPFIDIVKTCCVKIDDYNPRFCFYGNSFDFDENKDRVEECQLAAQEHKTYILRILVKNISRTNIEKITVGNLYMEYQRDTEDTPEETGFVLPFTNHEKKCACKMNILPNGDQWLYFIFTDMKDELENVNFDNLADYDRLFISFDIILQGKEKEQRYKYYCYLSKESEQQEITGAYVIDFSCFCIL